MNNCYRPILLVEGDGDQLAAPLLIRDIAASLSLYEFTPASRPKKIGAIPTLDRPGQLERYVSYAETDPNGDSVLVLIDCDDACAADIAHSWSSRLQHSAYKREKPVAIAFVVREYESLFLGSLKKISEKYPDREWIAENFPKLEEIENYRDAKGAISRCMKNKKYKEMIDQPAFTASLDAEKLREFSRSYRHLESAVKFLASDKPELKCAYPLRPKN